MNAESISLLHLAAGYLLLLVPLGFMLWYGIHLSGKTIIAAIRMTAQLLFVGFYLQVVFRFNNAWLTVAWLVVMILVADISIVRDCGFSVRKFVPAIFISLLAGTAVPLLYFTGIVLAEPHVLEARYVIPIGGMILGNCLRADIIGIGGFYRAVNDKKKAYMYSLSQGATMSEALRPYFQEAFQAAVLPTITTMSTIGLVSLPGMMTGVILGGADPMTAIRYQIAIMIAIFTGTCITIAMAILLTVRLNFSDYGIMARDQ